MCLISVVLAKFSSHRVLNENQKRKFMGRKIVAFGNGISRARLMLAYCE